MSSMIVPTIHNTSAASAEVLLSCPQKSRTSTRQIDDLFPAKLYKMLESIDLLDLSEAVSWLPDGHAFSVKDKHKFTVEVMPLFFKATKIRSFHRQLHLWGFSRIKSGQDAGVWWHKNFVRGSPSELKLIVRTHVKSGALPTAPAISQSPRSQDNMAPILTSASDLGLEDGNSCHNLSSKKEHMPAFEVDFIEREHTASQLSSADNMISAAFDSHDAEVEGLLKNMTNNPRRVSQISPMYVQDVEDPNILDIVPLPCSCLGDLNASFDNNTDGHQINHSLKKRASDKNNHAPILGPISGSVVQAIGTSAKAGLYLPTSISGESMAHFTINSVKQKSEASSHSPSKSSLQEPQCCITTEDEDELDEFSMFIDKMIRLV